MNIYQRIILILRAIALVIAIWTFPRVVMIGGRKMLKYYSRPSKKSEAIVGIMEPRTATMRAVAVVGATVFNLLCTWK